MVFFATTSLYFEGAGGQSLGQRGHSKEHGERKNAKDPSPLEVKEVLVGERRYVVCYNPEQARKDAADRSGIVAALRATLKQGDKALVGNEGFRRGQGVLAAFPRQGCCGKVFSAVGVALPPLLALDPEEKRVAKNAADQSG